MKRFASALLALLLVLTMVVPNLTALAGAATATTKGSDDKIAERPDGASVFFDAENEAYSFNTATYWDVYQQDLGVKRGSRNVGSNQDNVGLTLTSSTDGALVKENSGGGGNLGGALRIDYETAATFVYKQYSESDLNGSDTNFDYSDGSSTVVGWGGDFKYNDGEDAKYLAIAIKQVTGPALETVLKYLTIHLVDQSGSTIDTIRRDKLRESYTENSSFNTDYVTYIYGPINKPTSANSDVQGMKIMFERGDNGEDISGSVELAYVGICTKDSYETNNRADWIDFCPFNYDHATLNGHEENGTRPYLRPNANDTRNTINVQNPSYVNEKDENKNKNAVVSGYNVSTLSHYDWHAWTMSTSDANIVSANNASHNGTGSFNALEIKYQHTDFHTTYAKLTGAAGRTREGQWLAITMKAEDLAAMKGKSEEDIGKIQIVLKNGDTEVKKVPLEDFLAAYTDGAGKINLGDLRNGYRTLFYNTGKNTTITTVEFDFSGVEKAVAGEDTHRIYVKDIYLFDPTLTIEKTVNQAQAAPGDTLTYTLTVKNPYNITYDKAFDVTDTLPEGLSYVPNSTTITGLDHANSTVEPSVNGQKLTWNFSRNMKQGDTMTITFMVTVDKNAVDGTVYKNVAMVADISSNEVETTVRDNNRLNKVFYAQVGQNTTLPLDLGKTMVESPVYEEQKVTSSFSVTVQDGTNNYNGGNAVSATLRGQLTIPENATDVTLTMTGPTGGFIFANNDSVKIGGTSWVLDKTHLNTTFTQTGKIMYHFSGTHQDGQPWDDPSFTGAISGFANENGTVGKISLMNVPKGENMDVTINLAAIYHTAKSFTFDLSYKIEVQNGSKQDPVENTFKGIESLGENPGFEVTALDNAENQNLVNLNYLSRQSGVKTFTVKMNVGNSETTVPVQVTVYNYEVKDYKYVLDYGLPVYLTGNNEKGQSIQSFSGTTLLDGAQDGLHFFGVSDKKINENNTADPADYIVKGYVFTKSFKNGEVTTSFGEVSSEVQTILYTPTRFMDSADIFYYGVQVTNQNVNISNGGLDATNATPVMEGKITVVPASIVYYEDNFSKSGTGEANGDNGILYGGEHETKGDSKTDRFQSKELNLRYGYDTAYENDSTYSGGSATEMKAGSYAVFQFKGSGIDIISSTADNTGTVYVYVYDKAAIGDEGKIVGAGDGVTPELKKVKIVNTYYENNGKEGLYQIPVVNIRELDAEETHVVKIVVSSMGEKKNSVYLDGLRIYNPMGEKGNTYYDTSELNTGILELRDMILGKGYQITYDKDGKATVTAGTENIQASLVRFGNSSTTFLTGATVTENFTGAYYGGTESNNPSLTANLLSYLVQGPNNEVYLSEGYGIAFQVKASDSKKTLQVGAKMLMGSPNLQYLNNNDQWENLNTGNGGSIGTATEMYYEIPLDKCKIQDGEYLVVLRVGNGNADDEKPKNVISLTYLKASNDLTFSPIGIGAEEPTRGVSVDTDGITALVEPGTNKRRTITFATDMDVLDVRVCLGGKEVTATAASYVFYGTGTETKTWLVTYDASQSGAYSLKLILASQDAKGIITNAKVGE